MEFFTREICVCVHLTQTRDAQRACAEMGISMREEIKKKIEDAEVILVGLGEDFNNTRVLHQDERYLSGKNLLMEAGYHWLVPMWAEYCSSRDGDEQLRQALDKLEKLLEGKNYFIVSVSTQPEIMKKAWKNGNCVMPCGGSWQKQCVMGCEGQIMETTAEDMEKLKAAFEQLWEGKFPEDGIPELGTCKKCGRSMVLNNIYAESYDESGYQEKWKQYTKWLQGTINRRLLILELGVSLQFPTVIRWPFEKVAFYNQKAFLYRVTEKLYQMTKELSDRGTGIEKNAIDWINEL